jgi:hypothetical protein
MPSTYCATDSSSNATVFQLAFVYLTYIAAVFLLLGWGMLIYVMVSLHKATRTGELIRSNCETRKGYLEYETGQHYAHKAYITKLKAKLEQGQGWMQTGIAFLAASVTLPLLYNIIYLRLIKGWKRNVEGDKLTPTHQFGTTIPWIIFAMYALSALIATHVKRFDEARDPIILQVFVLIAIAVAYILPKKTTEAEFFEQDELNFANVLWPVIYVFGGGLWLASTVFYYKLDALMGMYPESIGKVNDQLLNMERPTLLAYLGDNYIAVKGQDHPADNPPTEDTFEELIKTREAPLYVMHKEGNEFKEIETVMKRAYPEIVNTTRELRSQLQGLRTQNIEFTDKISAYTGVVTGLSALVIVAPLYVVYQRAAPAVFGI